MPVKESRSDRDLFAELERSIELRTLARVYFLLQGKTVSFGVIEKAFGVDRGQLHRYIKRHISRDIPDTSL